MVASREKKVIAAVPKKEGSLSTGTILLLATRCSDCNRLRSWKQKALNQTRGESHRCSCAINTRGFFCVSDQRDVASFERADNSHALVLQNSAPKKRRGDFPVDKCWLNASGGTPIRSLRSVMVYGVHRFGVRSSIPLSQCDSSSSVSSCTLVSARRHGYGCQDMTVAVVPLCKKGFRVSKYHLAAVQRRRFPVDWNCLAGILLRALASSAQDRADAPCASRRFGPCGRLASGPSPNDCRRDSVPSGRFFGPPTHD